MKPNVLALGMAGTVVGATYTDAFNDGRNWLSSAADPLTLEWTASWKRDTGHNGRLVGTRKAFAAPVPGPETCAMPALGPCMGGWMARRRHRA